MKFVVDTSVIVKWLNTTNEEDINAANTLLNDALDGRIELIAPELTKYEIGNVLLKSKQLTAKEAMVTLEAMYTLPITFIAESKRLAIDTYSIATKHTITYYDAAFLSLAKEYSATLITSNIKHQGKPSLIKVIPLKNYS